MTTKSAEEGTSSGQGEPAELTEVPRRARRSDDEKVALVRQILASGNQRAELKRLGLYPNQFYDWKRRYAEQLGLTSQPSSPSPRVTPSPPISLFEEARALLAAKSELLARLRSQRAELDALIAQLES